MFIMELQVKHYRSIVNETLPCDSLTALVGRNGSGKSSFLSALALFYEPSATVAAEDFYNEDITQNIEIAVTFGNLAPEARMLFDPYINQETLTVVRVFSIADGKKSGTYYGMRLHNPDFEAVRSAGSARDAISSYAELKNRDDSHRCQLPGPPRQLSKLWTLGRPLIPTSVNECGIKANSLGFDK